MRSASVHLRPALAGLAAAIALALPPLAYANTFTCTTARLIVPWKPGGATDAVLRAFADTINAYASGPRLHVINIAGQGGNKGAREAQKSKPDGCTLLAVHQSAITSYLNGRVDFNWDAFEPVSLLTDSPTVVGAAPDAPWSSLDEMLEAAREKPDTITVGATLGGTSHFMWLMMEQATGAKFKYVPFDSTRERVTALLTNAVQLGALNAVAGKKYLAGGQLKAYGIAAETRSDQLPDVPTLKEQGVDLVYSLRRGVVVPKATTKEKIQHWAELFGRASAEPGLLEQMKAKGIAIQWLGPEDYTEWLRRTYEAHEKIAKAVGMYNR